MSDSIVLIEIKKDWEICIDCPMNYDGLECRAYLRKYEIDVFDKFDPYKEIPEWCEVDEISLSRREDSEHSSKREN